MVIVGGGTAGSVIASRLSADPEVRVCLIEGGPSDVGDQRVLRLGNRLNLLESDYDYDYPVVPQPRGNSFIADASVFPMMPTVNPMVTVLLIGERAADLISAALTGH